MPCRNMPAEEREVWWGDVPSMISWILRSTLEPPAWRERVERLVGIYERAQQLTPLGEGLVRSLGRVDAKMLCPEALDAWRRIWLDVGAGRPSLEIGLRLFDVGMRYLMTGDRRVLLDLLSSERQLVSEALGLSAE